MQQEVLAHDGNLDGAAAAAQAPLAGTPGFFGPPGERLFGWLLLPPAGAPQRRHGVVLCNPFGYEAMCTHRSYRAIARSLAGAGFAVLRFDLPGSGDSEGSDLEPGRVAAWLRGIGHAASSLRAAAGVASLSLFGVRLGATLALGAANEIAADTVIAWAPFPGGKAFVNEARAFRKLQGRPPPAEGGTGAEEVAGYLLTGEACRDLAALDLLRLTQPPARRVLILGRDDLQLDARLPSALRALGVEVSCETPAGYQAMMRDPLESQVPREAIDRMIAFLGDGAGASRARSVPHALRPDVIAPFAGMEEAVRFGAGDRLFGILTTSPKKREGAPTVVFLNTGSNHHVGPNRLYVRLARELAAAGFDSFRFDVSGIGDSAPVVPGLENEIYSEQSLADVKTALDLLGQRTGARQFTLLGLCSGAYLAFRVAVCDPRVAGQILINQQVFSWRKGDSLQVRMRRSVKGSTFYRRALVSRETWRRALRGEVNVRYLARVLLDRTVERLRRRAAAAVVLLRHGVWELSDVARKFRQFHERGGSSLLIYSSLDGGLDSIAEHLGAAAKKMSFVPWFKMVVLEGPDHTFTPVWTQAVLVDHVVQHLVRSTAAGAGAPTCRQP